MQWLVSNSKHQDLNPWFALTSTLRILRGDRKPTKNNLKSISNCVQIVFYHVTKLWTAINHSILIQTLRTHSFRNLEWSSYSSAMSNYCTKWAGNIANHCVSSVFSSPFEKTHYLCCDLWCEIQVKGHHFLMIRVCSRSILEPTSHQIAWNSVLGSQSRFEVSWNCDLQ